MNEHAALLAKPARRLAGVPTPPPFSPLSSSSSTTTAKRTPPFKALMLVCAICFGLFSVAVSKSKTYRENRAILRALGVKPASYASCEDVVERETRGMTFYATDLFGWSPFPVETRFDAASYRRRNLKYSLSRSSSSAAESAAPSEEENEEDVPVAVASPKEIENEVGGTDTSEDERGERQQQQLVVTKEDGNEEEKTKEAATTTTETETETTDDDNEQESSVGSKDVREYENEEETEKKAAEKLANPKELLFVPPDKTPYRYAYIDWLKPALQDDPRIANHINDADMVMFTDSFADVNPYMAKFLHENMDEDEESRTQWWLKQKDNSRVLAQNLFSRMAEERRQASRAVAFTNFLFPSERFILREKDEIGVPEYAQVGSDAVVGDNKKNSNVFLAVTDVSPTHIWEKAYKTNGIAMLVPFTANSDIARASLKLKNNFFYDRERPEMFYTGDLEFLHETMQEPMKKLVKAEGQNIHLGSSKTLNSDNDVKDYAEGSLRSSFCWIPRSYDKARFETSTRVIDSIAAGCIPIVVVDTIAESLPFKWAVDYKSFILQVPEKIFVENPLEVAAAVSKISSDAMHAMRSKMLDARVKLVWNDRNDVDDACDKETGRCSLAPRLFLDEMLYRVKKNNAEIQSAMCDRRTDGDGSSDWVDGGVWSGEKLCAPWLAETGLCKATRKTKDLEREETGESTLSKADDVIMNDGGREAEETDDKTPKAKEEEEEEEEEEEVKEDYDSSFDINEELEAAISGKSRAEKMEEIEAEQKLASEKEKLRKAQKESERKQIEEALKRNEDGNYESTTSSSVTSEKEEDISSDGKEESDEQETRDQNEQHAEDSEEKLDTNAMESSIENEIAATIQPEARITSTSADESAEKAEEEEEEEDQKKKTPEEEARDLADDFASASDSGKDSASFGEDLYKKLVGGGIKSAVDERKSSSTAAEEKEDNTGIDLDAFNPPKSTNDDDDDGIPVNSRDDVDDGWSSSLDNEAY